MIRQAGAPLTRRSLARCIWLCVLVPALPFMLRGAEPAGLSDDVFSKPLGPAGRPGFDAVCADMARHRVVQGRFVQTKTLKRLGRSLVSRGNFSVDAERGMIWDTREPFPSVMAVGRDFVVQQSGGGVTRLDAAGNETFIRISETISAVFSGDSQKLLARFDVYFAETGKDWKMGLVPRDASIRSFAAAIIMEGDSVLRRVFLFEQNGDTIRYELSNHSYPASLSADEQAWFTR